MLYSRACLFLMIVVGAGVCSCSSPPDPGFLELQRSREAIRQASSWQSDVTAQYPNGQRMIVQLTKVECPGRMDRVGILRDLRNTSVHEIWFDGTYYNKSNAPSQWLRSPANLNPFPECGQGPGMIWDGAVYGDLDAVHATGEIRRGATENFDSESCVWWEVAPAKGAPPHYSVCVAESDHLPRVIRSREHDLNYVYTLSHWNATEVSLPLGAQVLPN